MNKKKQLPAMPKATAVWLVENTGISFKQIADFCGMHELEVKGIADGEVATGITGMNPVVSGQISKASLEECENDFSKKLVLLRSKIDHLIKTKKTSRYTPLARRKDKPEAIAWLVRNYPDISDGQIVKLIGTTKSTIAAIRDRSHWNIKNINPRDPVLSGLCTQVELDNLVIKVHGKLSNENKEIEDENI